MKRLFSAFGIAAMLAAVSACGDDRSLSQRGGAALGSAATDFAEGLGAGVDRSMKADVAGDESLTAHGLSLTVSKGGPLGSNQMSVYVTSGKAFKGRLIAKAIDRENREIGRAVLDIELAENDAKYANFNFNDEMDSQLVKRYVVAVK